MPCSPPASMIAVAAPQACSAGPPPPTSRRCQPRAVQPPSLLPPTRPAQVQLAVASAAHSALLRCGLLAGPPSLDPNRCRCGSGPSHWSAPTRAPEIPPPECAPLQRQCQSPMRRAPWSARPVQPANPSACPATSPPTPPFSPGGPAARPPRPPQASAPPHAPAPRPPPSPAAAASRPTHGPAAPDAGAQSAPPGAAAARPSASPPPLLHGGRPSRS
mmetsp:Transcript_33783/g.85987  ORF Transcript_33783/g.85987 Transcript_33783/m.85987 type:complete len:217 (-) Transcript_33783:217-867(-)